MGLRGTQAEFRPHQREVWRAYLTCKVLGYWPQINRRRGSAEPSREAVARLAGVDYGRVVDILNNTSPVGCFR